MKKITHFVVLAVYLCLLTATASAFNITMQYPAGTLFSATHDPLAKAAINQAAADISAAITTNLAAINTDTYSGNVSGNVVSHDWYFSYLDPLNGTTNVVVDPATIPANTVRLQVGARSILGSTLGVGGPAGIGLSVGYSYFNANQLPSASLIANSQSQSAYKRSGGPVIGNISLSQVVEGVTVNTSVDYGIAYGSLALDWDGNNNGVKDSDTELNNYWHFNHATPVAAGKNDLYSVALHEILHAVGIGASQSWNDLNPDGTRHWTGSNVIALTGSGTNLLSPTVDHIAANMMSTNAYDGLPQPPAMTPNILQGTRKYLTALDLAFLRDIGYSTINWATTPSSPADFNNDGHVNGLDLAMWQAGYGINANGDTDDDGDTDGRDFLVWQREYTGAMLTATVTVPEPFSVTLAAVAGVLLLGCRRSTR